MAVAPSTRSNRVVLMISESSTGRPAARIFTQNNQYLHVWDSADLRSFTGYRQIRMHNLATHTWAPTAFWVASRNQYAIVYSAYNGADVFMVNYTSDFRTE